MWQGPTRLRASTWAAVVALVVPLLGAVQRPAGAQVPGVLEFVTIWQPPGGGAGKVKTHPSLINTPTWLDVDGDGVGTQSNAELFATLFVWLDTSGEAHLRLEVDRNPVKLTTPLPVAVEVVGAVPGSGGTTVAFGYDARTSNAPLRFSAVPTITTLDASPPAERKKSLAVDVSVTPTVTDPVDALAVTGELFNELGDRRVDAVRARVGLSPVPSSLRATATAVEKGGTAEAALETERTLTLRTNRPTVASGTVCLLAPGGSYPAHAGKTACDADRGSLTVIEATVDKLAPDPTRSFRVALRSDGKGRNTASYESKATVDEVNVVRTERTDGVRQREDRVELTSMPTTAEVTTIDSDGSNVRHTFVIVDASAPIGTVEATILQRGAVPPLPAGLSDFDSYAYVVDNAEHQATVARVQGVKSVRFLLNRRLEAAPEGPRAGPVTAYGFTGTLNPGTLRAVIDGGPRTLELSTSPLPGDVWIAGLPEVGSVAYRGSAPIDWMTLRASDPEGLFKTVRSVDVRLEGVPTRMGIAYPGELDADLQLQATGEPIGKVEFVAGSSPSDQERLPADVDGFLLRDLPNRFLLHGRVTGLHRAAFDDSTAASEDGLYLTTTKRFEIDASGGRPFRVDVERKEDSLLSVGARTEYVRATLDPIKRNTVVRVVTSRASEAALIEDRDREELRLEYSADEASSGLTFETNLGKRVALTGSLSPLPKTVTFCKSPGNRCLEEGRSSGTDEVDKGSMLFDAADYTTINLLDCKDGDQTCHQADEFLFIKDLTVKHMSYWRTDGDVTWHVAQTRQPKLYLNTATSADADLTVFEDTNAIRGGYLLTQDLELVIPDGFWARDRLVQFLTPVDYGEIHCPAGTYIEYDIDWLNWEPDVTDLVCS